MPRIAVVGKGGSGKTTVVATLSRLASRRGASVIAVDGDPSLNLAMALGLAREVLPSLVPWGTRTGTAGSTPSFRDGTLLSEGVAASGIWAPDGVLLLVGVEVQEAGVG